MKRIFTLLSAVTLMVLFLAGCKKESVTQIVKFSFTQDSYTITESGELALSKNIILETNPADAASGLKPKFSVNNESLAEVDMGYLVPKGTGEVILYATVLETTVQCKVIIEPVKITKITLSESGDKTLFLGNSMNVSVSVEPSDAKLSNVKYEYDSNIIDVIYQEETSELLITAKAEGETTLVAYSGSVKSQDLVINSAVNEITKIVLSESGIITIPKGVTTKLVPKITCTDNNYPPTYPDLRWEVGYTTTGVTLDQEGNMTITEYPGGGFIGVYYKHNEDVYAGAIVASVEPEVLKSLSIAAQKTSVVWGEEFKVYVSSFSPADADMSNLQWRSSSSKVTLKTSGFDSDGKYFAIFKSNYEAGSSDLNVTITASVASVSATANVSISKQHAETMTYGADSKMYHMPHEVYHMAFVSKLVYTPSNITQPDDEFTFSAEKYASNGTTMATAEITFGELTFSSGNLYVPIYCSNADGGKYKLTATAANSLTASFDVVLLPNFTVSDISKYFYTKDFIGSVLSERFTPEVYVRNGYYYGDDVITIKSIKSGNETVCKPSVDGKSMQYALIELGYIGTTEVTINFSLFDESTTHTLKSGVINQCRNMKVTVKPDGESSYTIVPEKAGDLAGTYNLIAQGRAKLMNITYEHSDGSVVTLVESSSNLSLVETYEGYLVYNYKTGTAKRYSSRILISGAAGYYELYYRYEQ